MLLILKHETYQIKNGYAVRSPELKLAAHGATIELARRNLERTVELFLKPFERQGILDDKIQSLGLTVEPDGANLVVQTEN
jgi:predicted RNase H-like HicB family nuclease